MELNKNYGSLTALKNFNLEVSEGDIWGVLGPNGSGKTTALGIILGVTNSSSGQVNWFDQPASAKSLRQVGSILEQPNFYPWLSAEQNLKVLVHLKGLVAKSEVQNKLELVGLWDRRSDRYAEYSLGMKQRLALAAAMLGDPKVLILDEPTNGLDAKSIVEVRNIILDYAKNKKTVILASHILDEVEKTCSHVLILQKGVTLSKGRISETLKGGNSYEISSEKNTELLSLLPNLQHYKSHRQNGTLISVDFYDDMKPDMLNKMLFDRGVVLNHLAKQSHGLEKQFLKLLEQNSTASKGQ